MLDIELTSPDLEAVTKLMRLTVLGSIHVITMHYRGEYWAISINFPLVLSISWRGQFSLVWQLGILSSEDLDTGDAP